MARLVEEHGDADAAGAARQHHVAREGERAARFEDVVDEQDIAAMHVAVDILDDLDALRDRAGAVARQGDELDFRRKARRVQGACQVGSEDEGALEDGDDEKVLRRAGRDLGCKLFVALGDLPGIVERFDLLSADNLHREAAPWWRRGSTGRTLRRNKGAA